jgi:hypothetical protein
MYWYPNSVYVCFIKGMHYLGVTGIEVVGRDGEALPVTLDILSANPPDLHTLPGHEQDDRTLDK